MVDDDGHPGLCMFLLGASGRLIDPFPITNIFIVLSFIRWLLFLLVVGSYSIHQLQRAHFRSASVTGNELSAVAGGGDGVATDTQYANKVTISGKSTKEMRAFIGILSFTIRPTQS